VVLLGFGILTPQPIVTIRNQRKKLMKKNFKKAFSLLELSIVILIISILIAGSMTASVTAMNNAKYKVTRDRMSEIYKAMGNYLINAKALPCPASLTAIKSSDPTYGTSGTAGDCTLPGVYTNAGGTIVYGAIPAQTLGLNTDMTEDGFGSKFTYIVVKALTNITDTAGFGAAAVVGNLVVKESLSSAQQINNTSEAMFVIISHGNNKLGAFNSNAATQNVASTEQGEQKNHGSLTGSIVTFADTYFISASANSDSFDDVLFYKSKNMALIDFNALFLVSCPQQITSENCEGIGGNCTWPKSSYNQIVSATENCATGFTSTVSKPTRRCGAFGAWQVGTINPCTN
jgi:prepilin-type N-terminal cleavage/methylation domain-containing protein